MHILKPVLRAFLVFFFFEKMQFLSWSLGHIHAFPAQRIWFELGSRHVLPLGGDQTSFSKVLHDVNIINATLKLLSYDFRLPLSAEIE